MASGRKKGRANSSVGVPGPLFSVTRVPARDRHWSFSCDGGEECGLQILRGIEGFFAWSMGIFLLYSLPGFSGLTLLGLSGLNSFIGLCDHLLSFGFLLNFNLLGCQLLLLSDLLGSPL